MIGRRGGGGRKDVLMTVDGLIVNLELGWPEEKEELVLVPLCVPGTVLCLL